MITLDDIFTGLLIFCFLTVVFAGLLLPKAIDRS
jgi:hypothetical protein